MKIKMLHTLTTIPSLDYSGSFSSTRYKIEALSSPLGYVVNDKSFIPMHNIKEIVFESEELKPVLSDMSDWPKEEASKSTQKSLKVKK